MMWKMYNTESEFLADFNDRKSEARLGCDYAEGKWQGPGWYCWEFESRYFRRGASDSYAVCRSAAEMLERVNEELRELISTRRMIQWRVRESKMAVE